MTCAEFAERFDAWLAGTLTDADARAVEQHAAMCAACGARLSAVSQVGAISREIPPPPALREITLRAVAQRRAIARWRRMAAGITAVAAIALLFLISRPTRKSASDFPGASTELIAMAHARPELADLDAAERDVEHALHDQPADSALTGALTRIRRQREALRRLVTQAKL
jgi:hypothetical protein